LNNTSFPSRPHPFIIQNNEVDLEIIINPEESSEFFAKPGEIRINESNFEQFVPVQSLDSKRTCAGKSLCGLCKGQLNTEIETRLLPCGDAFHGQCIRKYMVEENNRICLVCNRNYS
jgi:Ring finger domain